MKPTFVNKSMLFAGLVCGLLLLSACATSTVSTEAESEDPGNFIKARAMARWDALLSGDLAGAYGYLSPAVRSSIDSLQYQRSVLLQKVRWTSAEYIGESCEETICKVSISLGYTVHGALPGIRSYDDTQDVEEVWMLIDGAWYFIPSE